MAYPTMPLTEGAYIQWPINGTQVAYGLRINPTGTALWFIKQNVDGSWDIVRNPTDSRDTGIMWAFYHSGPVGGYLTPADPDGRDDPLPEEQTLFLDFINKHGARGRIMDYLNEVNTLADAVWGKPSEGPVEQPTDTFQDFGAANVALKAVFADIRVVNERLAA